MQNERQEGEHIESLQNSLNRLTLSLERTLIMLHKNDFAIEQLEERLEMFCIYLPYVGTCYKKVWFVTIPYPCIKYRRICF